jgi:hypothetical protein
MLIMNISWIAGFLAVTATSAAAQVGEIPERYASRYYGPYYTTVGCLRVPEGDLGADSYR